MKELEYLGDQIASEGPQRASGGLGSLDEHERAQKASEGLRGPSRGLKGLYRATWHGSIEVTICVLQDIAPFRAAALH